MLSKRAERLILNQENARLFSPTAAIHNPYDPSSNPNGIINLGVAVNELMDDIWIDKFPDFGEALLPKKELFRYYKFHGSNKFRKEIASFLNIYFNPHEEINFKNLIVVNGVLLSLDILMGLVGDEGEYVLCPTPAYNGYFVAGIRWDVNYVTIHMKKNTAKSYTVSVVANPLSLEVFTASPRKDTGEPFRLTIEQIEKTYCDNISKGKKIKAFLLNNPHNPLGVVFSKELVLQIMTFCEKYNLHLIADEAYCMSVFDTSSKFHSVLELSGTGLMDKNRIHFIWGLSKDLCLTSFRTGIIHTENKKVLVALEAMTNFQALPLQTMDFVEKLISDIEWFKTAFVPVNHNRMRKAYVFAKSLFDSASIETTNTSAGFFFLANFRKYLSPPNEENTKALVTKFYEHKVYVVPYWQMKMEEAGWVRIVFTLAKETFEEGFKRLKEVLDQSAGGENN